MDGVVIVFLSAASKMLDLAIDFFVVTREDEEDSELVKVRLK
jgi:hypothetical protein